MAGSGTFSAPLMLVEADITFLHLKRRVLTGLLSPGSLVLDILLLWCPTPLCWLRFKQILERSCLVTLVVHTVQVSALRY